MSSSERLSPPTTSGTALPLYEVVLPNGLTVLGEPDPTALTFAAGYFVRTGARDETPEDMGASHFIEHLLFKGSDRMSGDDMSARFDALGANVNAFTSEEATVYHAATLPGAWRDLLGLLTELMRPALRVGDVETERGVILEEIAMYADQPESRLFDDLRRRAWGEHPLGHLVLGTPETVAGLTPERLRANFLGRYGSGNVTLVACGRFDWPEFVRAAEDITRDWPTGRPTRAQPDPTLHAGMDVVTDAGLGRAQLAFIAPGLAASDARREAAVVLSEILGGDNGRLYWSLIDPGLADEADLSHVEFADTGTFECSWSCDPERAAETLALVRTELEKLQVGGVTEQEVARARRKIAVGTVLRTETPYGRLFTLGMEQLYFGRPVTLPETLARFEAVTAEDVNALLRERPFDRARFMALGPLDAELNALPDEG